MRLLRYESAGRVGLGVLKEGAILPLTALRDHFPTMLAIIEGGQAALDRVAAFVAQSDETIPLGEVRLLAPIERPGKYMAIGMNYRKHVEEAEHLGAKPVSHQFWFNKQTTCLAGPYDPIDPHVSTQLDYEVELGVVIGNTARNVRVADAPNHVFGYFVANDVSARDWQFHSPTFTVGKSFDTHGPIGPWIVTADEIDDPHALTLRCLVNGEVRQESSTGEMIFNIWEQIAYLSTAFTLEPGDLIATGTPDGVGVAMQPPKFLQPGDMVRCEIDGVGAIENRVAQPGQQL
ncbi:5-carboxymethyl-2-hydroxymuconate isomerase [Sphingobium sp. LB126]|uniref:fumarylacetoacetate hydrolase family protein n=1 Tax=Sphingobium sp. LB126 TaxID=1983755 RepID=UPI000C2084C9|nr:fumarylacetoacetate hydrolase family protein [Sphingobium sp. LB126]PJG46546.1 5-carboxymethyl-2-hydroxymuconate isomerase [Sphingobium sp. LB126]